MLSEELSERALNLLASGERHDPIVDVAHAGAWFRERGIPDCSKFVDFHSQFGGIEYWIPNTCVFLGMWERDVLGRIVLPFCSRDTQGMFSVSCGNLLSAQINLSIREDGFVFENDDLAYTSMVRCIEDHAAIAWVEQAYSKLCRARMVVRSAQPLDELGGAGVEVMREACDQGVVWWRGDGLVIRDCAMVPPDEGCRIVSVNAAEQRAIDKVRALLRGKIIDGA
ncbi:hypothetical protein HI113_14390 [Corallococcus exiguus]|uniref:hypothetical protein n=1 Tax=Corallococcus exiguus TaxID=83462 RepID=UPI001472BDCB|nr:hypothetical protein [Corallococcus exiguus]NNB95085.1 hypothetical protein [Corallococcus exiguus]NPD26620.1 hypothetical protein [Corallococcus exiguus]